jgi:hypothetical protein
VGRIGLLGDFMVRRGDGWLRYLRWLGWWAVWGVCICADAAEPTAPLWAAAKGIDKTTQQNVCLLQAQPGIIHDGHDDVKIVLAITPQKVLLLTASDIDLSYPGVGIQVGQRPLIVIDGLYKNQTAVIEKGRNEVVEQFKQGKEVTVYLGFWPTWPVTKTQVATFSLKGFRSAYAAFEQCVAGN